MNTYARPAALAAALLTGTAVFSPSPVRADDDPASVPTYATRDDSGAIKGSISAIDGKYDIRVRDAKGYVDRVRLHDGTIINPTGLRLAVGQKVTIVGTNPGDRYDANEIDTPYQIDDRYAYGGGYGYYGAPAIGYPYYGGFGPFGYGGFGYPFYGGIGVGFYGGGYYDGGYYGGYRGRGRHDRDGDDGRGASGSPGTRVGRPAVREPSPGVGGGGRESRTFGAGSPSFGGGRAGGGGGRR